MRKRNKRGRIEKCEVRLESLPGGFELLLLRYLLSRVLFPVLLCGGVYLFAVFLGLSHFIYAFLTYISVGVECVVLFCLVSRFLVA